MDEDVGEGSQLFLVFEELGQVVGDALGVVVVTSRAVVHHQVWSLLPFCFCICFQFGQKNIDLPVEQINQPFIRDHNSPIYGVCQT